MACEEHWTTRELEWVGRLTTIGSFWFHDGNAARPHPLLTKGGHSNGFFNGSRVIEEPILLEEICEDLIGRLTALGHLKDFDMHHDKVFGSAMGAVDISYEFGRQLSCARGFTEPVIEDDGKKRMKLKRFDVDPGTKVLVVEDVFTTGETTLETIAELEAHKAEVLPVVIGLVNRSGFIHLGERPIVSLIHRPMANWTPAECASEHLCSKGSKPVRPKENWAALTAIY